MRHVLILDLQDAPKAIADYLHWHRPGGPPKAVTRSIRESGISEMEIWHVGDRLVMVMEAGLAFNPDDKALRDSADPGVQAWERLMDRFQKRLPFASEGQKWMPTDRIYALNEQPQARA